MGRNAKPYEKIYMNHLVLNEANSIVSEKWVTEIVAAYGNAETTLFISPSGNEIKERQWDLASVTKLFSLVSILSMHENKLFSINKRVKDYTNKYPNLSDIYIYDLMNFSLELTTSSRIDTCGNYDYAIDLLHGIQIKSSKTTYSDMGVMVIVQLLNEINQSEFFFRDYTYDLLRRVNVKNTHWWKDLDIGKGNIENYDSEYRCIDGKLIKINTPIGTCHDPKARIVPYSGHSGLFSNTTDITAFANALLSGRIISLETLSILFDNKYDIWDETHHYGLLCNKKHPNTEFSEIPISCSDNSIAISGYTGTYFLLDFEKNIYIFIGANRIHNRITNLNHEDRRFELPCTKDYVFRKDVLVNLIADELCEPHNR